MSAEYKLPMIISGCPISCFLVISHGRWPICRRLTFGISMMSTFSHFEVQCFKMIHIFHISRFSTCSYFKISLPTIYIYIFEQLWSAYIWTTMECLLPHWIIWYHILDYIPWYVCFVLVKLPFWLVQTPNSRFFLAAITT